MKNESFWKVKPLPAILALVLVVLVVWNYIHILEVRGDLVNEIDRIEMQPTALHDAQEENARLKAINKALNQDAMKKLQENNELKSFLRGMSPEISALVEIAGCEICCDVGGKVVGMGPRLHFFKLMIDRYTTE